MSATPVPTILDLKLAFLRSQIQALSAPMRIPPNYRPADEDRPIRQKAIDEALYQLNARIQEHSKLVYSSQAQRHVAEQIDALYWMAGERDINGESAEGRLEAGMDFSADLNISNLPEAWEDDDEAQSLPAEAERFAELSARLKGLNEKRRELKERVARYKALEEGLAPFENVKENVQENLCTRDGEVEAELQKMRLLMARVKGRLEGLGAPESPQNNEMEIDFLDQDKKVEALFKNS